MSTCDEPAIDLTPSLPAAIAAYIAAKSTEVARAAEYRHPPFSSSQAVFVQCILDHQRSILLSYGLLPCKRRLKVRGCPRHVVVDMATWFTERANAAARADGYELGRELEGDTVGNKEYELNCIRLLSLALERVVKEPKDWVALSVLRDYAEKNRLRGYTI